MGKGDSDSSAVLDRRWVFKFILVPLVIGFSVYEAVAVTLVLLRGLT